MKYFYAVLFLSVLFLTRCSNIEERNFIAGSLNKNNDHLEREALELWSEIASTVEERGNIKSEVKIKDNAQKIFEKSDHIIELLNEATINKNKENIKQKIADFKATAKASKDQLTSVMKLKDEYNQRVNRAMEVAFHERDSLYIEHLKTTLLLKTLHHLTQHYRAIAASEGYSICPDYRAFCRIDSIAPDNYQYYVSIFPTDNNIMYYKPNKLGLDTILTSLKTGNMKNQSIGNNFIITFSYPEKSDFKLTADIKLNTLKETCRFKRRFKVVKENIDSASRIAPKHMFEK